MSKATNGGNPRLIALKVLEEVNIRNHVQTVMAKILTQNPLSASNRALCMDLAYGVLRNRITLDFILGKVLSKPRKLPTRMLWLLRMGAYGLLYQTRTPAYAVINETVLVLKRLFGQKLAGVANGALRALERQKELLLDPAWYGEDFESKRIFFGIPASIADLWRKSYGEVAADNLMRRSSSRPRLGVRLNPFNKKFAELKKAFDKLAGAEKLHESGFALAAGATPETLLGKPLESWEKEGAISFQSVGSQLLLQNLKIDEWKNAIWDCCAGVGGKALALMEWGCNIGLVSDLSSQRLHAALKSCKRLGFAPPNACQMDMRRPAIRQWEGDILIDAPCSGLGILARRPDIRDNFNPSGVFSEIQNAILEKAASCLAAGRKIAYCTCTLNPAENEELIENFLKTHSCFSLLDEWQTPHEHPWLEGMYGAVIEGNA